MFNKNFLNLNNKMKIQKSNLYKNNNKKINQT